MAVLWILLFGPGVPLALRSAWVQFTHGVFYVRNGDTANYAVFYEQLCWGKGAREHEAATQADFLFFAMGTGALPAS